jgi:hypothetical protein
MDIETAVDGSYQRTLEMQAAHDPIDSQDLRDWIADLRSGRWVQMRDDLFTTDDRGEIQRVCALGCFVAGRMAREQVVGLEHMDAYMERLPPWLKTEVVYMNDVRKMSFPQIADELERWLPDHA